MGNTVSSSIIDRSDDDINYNIEAEVISRDNAVNIPNIPTPIDIKYNKMYIIYQRIDGVSRTFILSIKIVDNNIFIYVTDIYTEKTVLVHVSKIEVTVDHNMTNYLKYIQVSRDFKLLSLPENGKINIYNLTKLLSRNILEYVDTVGIMLRADNRDVIRSDVEMHAVHATNATPVVEDSEDRIGQIDFRYVDMKDLRVYKCILCKDLFIIVHVEFNRFKKIVAIDYKKKILHEMMNLDLDMNESSLKFSSNGRYVSVYDGLRTKMSICDLLQKEPKLHTLDIKIDGTAVLDTICVSEDGRFIFYVEEDMKFYVYDTVRLRSYNLDPKITVDASQLKNIKFHLMDYSKFSNIDMRSPSECDNLYVLVGWDRTVSSAYYWMIRCSISGYDIFGPSFVDMKVEGKIEYVYNNGYMFIYKTVDGITVYDLNKVIPIRFAGMLASGAKAELDKLYNKYYPDSMNSYYDTVTIIGADDSSYLYPLSDYSRFLMSMFKPEKRDVESNIFYLKINANINIYGSTKSFSIFQDLLSGRINQTYVLTNIFSVPGHTGRHNMMADLMNHFYEYTRVIVLKESLQGDVDSTGFKEMKAMYIGYILLVLVIKYYSMMLKTGDSVLISNIKTSKRKNRDNIKIQERHTDLNIIDMFNENFPAFKSFTDRTIDLLLGEKTN